jgi:hypothetical protein
MRTTYERKRQTRILQRSCVGPAGRGGGRAWTIPDAARSGDAVLGRFNRQERQAGTNLLVIVALLQFDRICFAVWRNERTEATAKGADGARASW